MNVMIGIDPHKASHTAVAIGGDEDQLSSVKVRATQRQVDQLIDWAEPFEKRTWAIESAGGLGYLLAQQLVGRGENVLDVPATLASRVRMLATNRSNKNDPNDAHSIAVAALRAPRLRTSSELTMVKSYVSWPSATWTLAAIAPGSSLVSTPSPAELARGKLIRN